MKKEEIRERVEVVEKKKFRKKVIISVIFAIILILIVCLIIYLKKEKDLLTDIKSHYSENIVIKKDAKLYDENEKVIGKVSKGFSFTLEKEKIKDTKKQYFNIKDTSYYLYYEDIKPSKKHEKEQINNKYIVFNNNIKTSKKTKIYYNNKLVISINKELNLPVEYTDDTYYYVSYLDYIFQIKKEESIKIIEHQNTQEKEAEYISVLHYDTIYSNEKCNITTCITLDKIKEHFNYLKEQGYYSITLDEYQKYLDKKIRLKEKAILITTSNSNDTLTKLNQESDLKVEIVNDNIGLKFNNTNKKTTKDSNKESIDRYLIRNTTSNDNFYKMVLGDEVVDEVIFEKTANEQSIPVLNYHFFYDSSAGETCDENICLDVQVFRQQLDYLKNNGYKTLTMDEFTKWMYGEIELPEKSVLITIDDGAMGTGKHNGNKLIPILEEYDMYATLFLIAGWWDVENYRSKNLDIQSHTFDMHQYGDCKKGQVVCSSHDQLLADLQKSLTIVDNNNSFCFPFYSYSDSSLETVKEAGFKLAFVGGSRNAKRSDNKYLVPRYPIHKSHSMQQFINMVS